MCVLCVKFVCVKLLSVKFVYVKFVCSVCGGGREEEEEKEEPGIQNQKQEPHTKMWGKSTAQFCFGLFDALFFWHMEPTTLRLEGGAQGRAQGKA